MTNNNPANPIKKYFKEKNLSESYSVFISNALIEYSKENVEKGKKTEFQKIRKWRKKI